MVLVAFLSMPIANSFAQISIIKDEETENFIANISQPLFIAANIPFHKTQIYIVNDDSLNAFVSDGNFLFVHTGTILKAESDDEIRGVIAHEIGHIKAGHILRGKIKAQELTQVGLASMILAGASVLATGRGDVALAIMVGSQGTLTNHFLNYRIQEERTADEIGTQLLTKTNHSMTGLKNFMKKIEQENIMSGRVENEYFRTHPVTKERISFINNKIKQSTVPQSVFVSEDFSRVKAKLSAFLYNTKDMKKKYTGNTISHRYAKAIIEFKQMDIEKAIKEIDELIKEEPKNAFFHEIKAQIYLETGKVRLAKEEYHKALKIMPNSNQMKVSMAQATLEDNPSDEELNKTIKNLNQVILEDPTYSSWLLLARAYGAKNEMGWANYASAVANYQMGIIKIAKEQAINARKNSTNPTLLLKIDDLLNNINNEYKF